MSKETYIRCDRCDRISANVNHFMERTNEYGNSYWGKPWGRMEFDLCADCKSLFQQWLTPTLLPTETPEGFALPERKKSLLKKVAAKL